MAPRIPPLNDDEMSEAAREVVQRFLEGGRIDNVFRTIAHHPDLMRRWIPFVGHVLFKSTISRREREILIMRTGILCGCEYEWAQHVRHGKDTGMTEAEIAHVIAGKGLGAREDALLDAAGELHRNARIGDKTWAALSTWYDRRQMMDIVFAVGQYTLVCMALNSFGVEVDEYLKGYPPLPDAGAN
jgi:alkylhydroperoxidase family enzyme